MDDLMGRIDKLMGGNTEAEQAGIHRFVIKLCSSALSANGQGPVSRKSW